MARAMIVLVLCGCATSANEDRPTTEALAISAFGRVVGSVADAGNPVYIVQTASTVYTSADGQRTVTLVGTHHLGTPEYFRSLEPALRDAEAVWVEGVTLGDGSEADPMDCPEPLKPLEEWYELYEAVSGLSNQKDWEHEIRDGRWGNADADVARLHSLYAATEPASWATINDDVKRELAWLRALSRRGPSEDVQREARLNIVKHVYRYSREAEGGLETMNAERERAAWETIRAGLRTGARFAILYGAGHCPALEARLIEAGYVRRSATWHDVFVVEAQVRER